MYYFYIYLTVLIQDTY